MAVQLGLAVLRQGRAGLRAPPVRHARTDTPADQESEAGDTQPQYEDAEDLESDLQALYAIRDAAISQPGAGDSLSRAEACGSQTEPGAWISAG